MSMVNKDYQNICANVLQMFYFTCNHGLRASSLWAHEHETLGSGMDGCTSCRHSATTCFLIWLTVYAGFSSSVHGWLDSRWTGWMLLWLIDQSREGQWQGNELSANYGLCFNMTLFTWINCRYNRIVVAALNNWTARCFDWDYCSVYLLFIVMYLPDNAGGRSWSFCWCQGPAWILWKNTHCGTRSWRTAVEGWSPTRPSCLTGNDVCEALLPVV